MFYKMIEDALQRQRDDLKHQEEVPVHMLVQVVKISFELSFIGLGPHHHIPQSMLLLQLRDVLKHQEEIPMHMLVHVVKINFESSFIGLGPHCHIPQLLLQLILWLPQ